MTEKLGEELAEIGVYLLDDAYIAWFDAESDCQRALHAWLDGTSGNHTQKRTSPTSPRSIERKRPHMTCTGSRS